MCDFRGLMRLDQIRPAVGNATHGIRKIETHMRLSTGIIHFQSERRPALSSSRKISNVLQNDFKARHRSSEEILQWPFTMAQTKIDAGSPARCPTIANHLEELVYGSDADEICLTRNTTDGLDAVVYGVKLNSGDEILITPHEHESSLSPLNVRQDRDGIVLTEVDIPVLNIENNSPDIFLSAFEAKLSSSTKAILFSHICYTTGTRLPAKELCNWAKDNGLISIVDGAHAPGMIQLDFHDIGCDFYAGSGHKWQCGPGGTGILYLRNHGDKLPEFWTQNSSMYTFAVQPYGDVRGTYDIAYSLQHHGQLNIPAHLAFVDACELWEQIGRERIEHQVLQLSSYLKRKLQRRFGSQGTLFSPDIHEFSSGLTSFNPFDDITDDAKIIELVDRLESEAAYQIRYTDFKLASGDPKPAYACRISTHIFNDLHQIDGLVDAMYDICQTII